MKMIPVNKRRLVKLMILVGVLLFCLLVTFIFVNRQFLFSSSKLNCDFKADLHPDGTVWCNLGPNCEMVDCTNME